MMNLPATEKRLEEIRALQSKDEVCQLINSYLQSEWPEKKTAPEVVKSYLPMRAEISVHTHERISHHCTTCSSRGDAEKNP